MKPRNPLVVRNLKSALKDFLHAPATGGHITNEHLVVEVMGARGSNARDRSTFDGVREHYGRKNGPAIDTFAKAFNACWKGQRDWREFDITTLRETWPEFQHLGLPEKVEAAMQQEAYAAEFADPNADDAEYPPLELLHRKGPSRRKTRRPKVCKGSKNACADTKLARQYQDAKDAYHKLGEKLKKAALK